MAANLPAARFPYGGSGSSFMCGGGVRLRAPARSQQPGRGRLQLAAGGERMRATGGERTRESGLRVDAGPSSFALWLLETRGFGASYYVPSRDRALALPRRPAAAGEDNPKLRDTRFPPRSPQPSDIVFDVVAAHRDDRFSAAAAPELKLRPILTRPPPSADGSSGAAASPTGRARPPRFHFDAAKGGAAPDNHSRKAEEACKRSQGRSRSRRRRRRRAGRLRWVYESLVVVKDSADPEEDFLESMAEMIAANGVRSPRGLEELLAWRLLPRAQRRRPPPRHRRRVPPRVAAPPPALRAAADATERNALHA
uniref:Transcription repressor n=1 Tax=Saccharum hybrid cultivar R570 TaxID=131158 RepID=A0A059Q354_9POAL|nr:hypothetical protein SHCRBa_014_N06_R_40 [Saccharum hybrid cultivar R570]